MFFSPYFAVTAEKVTIALGIVLNMLLLFLIKKYSSTYLGSYKYLLSIFALYDIFLCVLHGLLNPIVMIVGRTFNAAMYAPWQSHEISAFYFACFTVPFALMNIHFLYLYWNVAHSTRVLLFSQPRFIALIGLYPILQCALWFVASFSVSADSLPEVRRVFAETHSAEIHDGWIVMDWRDPDSAEYRYNLRVIASTMSMMFGSFSAAATLGTLTYLEILKATTLSPKLRTMQYTLLAAVCTQTFIPLVCVYIPYFIVIISPFLNISGFGIVEHFSLLVSLFPGFDAIVIIVLIRDYRLGLAGMLGMRRVEQVALQNTQFTAETIENMLLCVMAVLCLLPLSDGLIGFTQSSAVKGVLMCNDQPAKSVKVKLYDNDSGPDLDDLMDSGKTDAEGRFSLQGHVDEFTTIDPKINIYHDCDDWLPCQRRISVFVPSKYVTKGAKPNKVYDAGVIQLAGKWAGETRDCLNMHHVLVVSCFLPAFAYALIGFTQSSAVKGVLMCDDVPAANVVVKLYGDDTGIDRDDLMDSGKTDENGHFSLQIHVNEFTTIDPKINIYHDYNDWMPCQRKISVLVPSKYVTKGEKPKKTYDAEIMQLSGK